MFEVFFTLSQAFQMMTLAPCLLVIIYLLLTTPNKRMVAVPVAYFISLGCSLLMPLLTGILSHNSALLEALKLGESFGTALSYLFIIQLITGSIASSYYLILAVPAIGGSGFIIASQISDEMCISGACLPSSYGIVYYNMFSSSLIFMLLIFFISRSFSSLPDTDKRKKHKYWLIIALVGMNLILLLLNLAKISFSLGEDAYILSESTIRLSFIYIVLTSMLRVFTDSFADIKPVLARKTTLSAREEEIAQKIEKMMIEGKIYRELELSRVKLSDMLGIKEHQLSAIISVAFKKSFSEYINYYRIEESKQLLKEHGHSVTAISYDVGFNSLTSFNRVFKEMTGLSPSEYRSRG